jgi:membrane protein YqaA with SNARE-associated domain
MAANKPNRTRRWLKLGLTALVFLVISIGLGYLIQSLLANYQIPTDIPVWAALLVIFGILFLINLTVLPLPFGIAVMLAASSQWNPVLVALAGAAGASLGEFSGYFFGYLGKRIAFAEETPGYNTVRNWIRKYGMWAIALISFQPILPFEIGGFIAGVLRMPVRQFLPAIFIGRFPKYLIFIYLGSTILHLFSQVQHS